MSTSSATGISANGGNAGNLNEMTKVPDSTYWNTYAADPLTVTITEVTAGTNTAEACSARGVCDYSTGLCKCFRGYRMDDCHLQHALALVVSYIYIHARLFMYNSISTEMEKLHCQPISGDKAPILWTKMNLRIFLRYVERNMLWQRIYSGTCTCVFFMTWQ
jgi:hypothetical protein